MPCMHACCLERKGAPGQIAPTVKDSNHEFQNHAKILAKGADSVMGARKLERNSPGESMPGLHLAMLTSRTQKQRDTRRAGERRGCFMHSVLDLTGARESYHQCLS